MDKEGVEVVDRMRKAMEFITLAVNDEGFKTELTKQEAVELLDGMVFHFLFLLDLNAKWNDVDRLEAFGAYSDLYRVLLIDELREEA